MSAPRITPRIVNVLSIAGTDPTGGAGIQADLKSVSATGGYGMAVVTALVAQNTRGVRSIHLPPVSFLREQLDSVSDDVTIDAVKIGMLSNLAVIDVVTEWLDRVRPPIVVLDPVMVATSGDRLLDAAAERGVRALLARVHIVTPNLPELAVLAEAPVATDWTEALEQGRLVAERYGVRVLVKGGHLGGSASPDALVEPGGRVIEFAAERIDTVNTHGTGCSLSSALATLQARLGDWEHSVRAAKLWLTDSLRHADELQVGQGHGPVHHFAALWRGDGLPAGKAPSAPAPHLLRDEWWFGIADLRSAIDDLDFIRRLSDGTLPQSAFSYYLAQDALYLRDYSRALARASQLAPTLDEQSFWAVNSHGSLAVEMELHRDWLGAAAVAPEPNPVTTNYLNHLLAVAGGSDYAALVAALLPCFWIYQDVGERLAAANHAEHPFNAWLSTYADPAFAESTRQAIEIVEAAALLASDAERGRMWEAFRASAAHEVAFFAMGTARAVQPMIG
ncbi:bifunctional hydroxymethylpyrimidine kinase/phosphomethylpyrimidine kinase [Cryobacterium frigoriphilum]|uniref:Bifunctional hydroxymethylpyrimidine kinase/phosphomethylpyrimidine kinase n=1 Tax=Cryobacterium frigoriphilum TaxID=1259150 RepID=A0A4R8ZUW1_9MICO|nr:bifunctional hydroxymethylpyrimidine kinase/phosphomethylpyrimidine kinase [Cryobacterium frigoriphilum]TFD46540.1 bifunctional hydroxymethylpyrimidine kinase/phosphomethylpyrimidine kinase [Cryobacterium frigoriphilum]